MNFVIASLAAGHAISSSCRLSRNVRVFTVLIFSRVSVTVRGGVGAGWKRKRAGAIAMATAMALLSDNGDYHHGAFQDTDMSRYRDAEIMLLSSVACCCFPSLRFRIMF